MKKIFGILMLLCLAVTSYAADGWILSDPGADRMMGWDESAGTGGAMAWFTMGTGLSISNTTLSVDLGADASQAAPGNHTHSGYMLESNIGTGANNYPKLGATPGTPDGTKFYRDDNTWAVPAGTPQVYPGAGIPKSTGSAWDTSYAIGTGAGSIAAGDHAHTGTYQAADADIPTVAASQEEMEAGTEAAVRSMSPLRVAQAIAELAPGSNLTCPDQNVARTTEPTTDKVAGCTYRANNDDWDPITYAGTDDYFVLWTGSAWVGLIDINGNLNGGDPGFTDPTNLNFAIASDSILKDAGYDLSAIWANAVDKVMVSRPQGAAWDIGAYEYEAGEDPPAGGSRSGLIIHSGGMPVKIQSGGLVMSPP